MTFLRLYFALQSDEEMIHGHMAFATTTVTPRGPDIAGQNIRM